MCLDKPNLEEKNENIRNLYALPIHEIKKGVKLGDTFG
jgi:hypothetical protein